MTDDFPVTAAAGTLSASVTAALTLPHRWTPEGVAVCAEGTGAHLLHLSVAVCVLNDLYREAERAGVALRGARVTAAGGFDAQTWTSTGIAYRVETDPPATDPDVARLVAAVEAVAEVPRALRAGTEVARRA